MQKADGVVLVIVGAEAVRADHLREPVGAMSESAGHRPHFVQDRRHARLRRLPGSLGPGHAAADDVDGFDRAHLAASRRESG